MGFEIHDIVRLGNGTELIITGFNPTRPSNRYRGVKVKGQGKEYIFGDKHLPVKVGKAGLDHPALRGVPNRTLLATDAAPDRPTTASTPADQAAFCQYKKLSALPMDAPKWDALAATKVGAPIRILTRGKCVDAVFIRLLRQGQRYNFVARLCTGGTYKWPISSLAVEPSKHWETVEKLSKARHELGDWDS